jgi:uncharacterized membrane protein
MMKKVILALSGLVFGFALIAPPKASAQVRIGIGVGVPGYVVVQPNPYYAAPAYYGPGYAYAAPVYGGGGYGYRHDGWRDDRRDEGDRHEGRHDDRHDDGRRNLRR